MAVLLIAEHNNKELRPFTLNAATAASQIDSDVHAVIIGQNSADAVKELSELPVIKKVLSVEGAPSTLNTFFITGSSDNSFTASAEF